MVPFHNKKQELTLPIKGLSSEETRWSQFSWHSKVYGSKNPLNDDEVNAAWNNIVPAHGVVAVNHEWAEAHQLPNSMSLPSDASKGVYIIDA